MALVVIGGPLALLGVIMMVRGWVYTLRPDGPMAKKRQKVNLKRGFTTDMRVFGRKVRRLGLFLLLVGGTMIGWQRASAADTAADAPVAGDDVPSGAATTMP